MPYERSEASLCRVIGQRTLDAQRRLFLLWGSQKWEIPDYSRLFRDTPALLWNLDIAPGEAKPANRSGIPFTAPTVLYPEVPSRWLTVLATLPRAGFPRRTRRMRRSVNERRPNGCECGSLVSGTRMGGARAEPGCRNVDPWLSPSWLSRDRGYCKHPS